MIDFSAITNKIQGKPIDVYLDKHTLIVNAVSLDYNKIQKAVLSLSVFVSSIHVLTPSISLLSKCAEEYNASELETKDDDYIASLKSGLEIELLIKTLTPIANKIPGGECNIKVN